MNRMMIDFETLDVAEMPVISSVGVVVFNENGLWECYSEKVDQQSCIDIGCTISADTEKWWTEQTESARNAAFGGTTPIKIVMEILVERYKELDCEEIWSRGSLADIRWTNNILDKLGIEKPWKFWQEMCFRTYLKYAPLVEFKRTGEAHNALDDAMYQAKMWIAANKQNDVRNEVYFQNIAHKPNFSDIFKASIDFKSNDIHVEIDFIKLRNGHTELNVYFQHFIKIDEEYEKLSYKRLIHSDYESDDLYISEVLKAFDLFTDEYIFKSEDWDDSHIKNNDMPF